VISSRKKIVIKQVLEFVPAIVFCDNDDILRHSNGFIGIGKRFANQEEVV
jgi:hypothetical protein